MRRAILLTLLTMAVLQASAGIEVSTTLPSEGTPEHRYTMGNAQGYFCNATTSPTRTMSNYAQFAFYASEDTDAFYIYNITSGKWLSYDKAASYTAQTGFVKQTATKTEGAYFRFKALSGGNYEISPYRTTAVANMFLNWYKGVGSDNPEDGSITLGLWSDGGASDKGSCWTFNEVGVKHVYTLFSDGMPSDAVVTIAGQEFRGLNAQGGQSVESETLETNDVRVVVGGGYVAKVTIDNSNYQIDIKFLQLFTPTESITSENQHAYLLKMPLAYVKKSGTNLSHTDKRSEADRFLFVEGESVGQYYLYDLTAKCYVYYTSATNGNSTTSTAGSNVKTTSSKTTARTWQMMLLSDATVTIIPGSITSPTSSSPALNFTGGIGNSCVLNLWNANDNNSAWEIIDPSAGTMACATLMYALPGAAYMHKLIPNTGESVTSVDFGMLNTLTLRNDRESTGNHYKYIIGTAPSEEGEYTYVVHLSDENGEASQTTVRLVVSSHLQSPTPMMSWLTWNWFARSISHTKMLAIARGMEKHGLIEAGFNTIVLDDAWAQPTTDKAALTYDSSKFPTGISGLKTSLKAINPKLKIGIYSDAGSMTCENYQPGSYGYESQHVALFDSWGVDMLKYDYCNSQASTKISYNRMGDIVEQLNAKRQAQGTTPFVFNICEWGKTQPWLWGAEAGGSSWRTTSDAREDWIGNSSRPGVLAGVDETRRLWMYAGVNRFNDLDMMCIGLHGLGGPSNNTMSHMSNGGSIQGLTDAQARTQMSLWCMLASPLALTCDLRTSPQGEANSGVTMPTPLITSMDIETLTNREILAIDQDSLGQQAEYMEALSTGSTDYSDTGYDIYVKDLSGGRFAVAVTNRSTSAINGVNLDLKDLYMQPNAYYLCREVWLKTETEIIGKLSTGAIGACETRVYVITPLGNSNAVVPTTQKQDGRYLAYDLTGRKATSRALRGITITNGKKSVKRPSASQD